MDDGPKRMLTDRKDCRSNWRHLRVNDVRKGFRRLAAIGLTWWVFAFCAFAQSQKIEINVDVSSVVGQIRPLHGVNGGTLHSGDTLDLSDAHRQLQVPLTRLHDCHWPNADVVDIHGFGMFSEHGVPHKNCESFKLFTQMLQTTARLSVSGKFPDAVAVLAGINPDRTQCTVLVSNHSPESYKLTVNLAAWPRGKRMEWHIESLEPNAKVTPESVTGDSLTLRIKPHSAITIHRR